MVVGVPVEILNSVRIESAGAPDNAVDDIILLQEEAREVGSVLTCDPGNQSFFHSRQV